MNALEELRQLTDERIDLHIIDGPPKTVTTAVSKALAQTRDAILVFEPFHITPKLEYTDPRYVIDFNRGVENMLRTITDQLSQVEERQGTNRKVPVVMKEVSPQISADDLRALLRLAKSYIGISTCPANQLESMMKLFSTYRPDGEIECVYTPEEAFASQILVVRERLNLVTKLPDEVVRTGWQRLGWDSFENHMKVALEHGEGNDFNTALIAGPLISVAPEIYLRRAINRTMLLDEESAKASWESNWSKYVGPSFNDAAPHLEQAFNTDISQVPWWQMAANSTGFIPSKRKVRSMSEFAPEIQNYIRTVAIPAYIKLLTNSNAVTPNNSNELSKLENKIDPITFYILAKRIFDAVEIESFRSKHPDYEIDFDIIDETFGVLEKI